jgi:hypothetical protein
MGSEQQDPSDPARQQALQGANLGRMQRQGGELSGPCQVGLFRLAH